MLLWGMLVGSTVAVRVAVLPSVSSSVPALSIRLAALRPSSATVTPHAAFTPPAMAAISVVPAQIATTSPPATQAVSGSALYHTTVWSAPAGLTVAVRAAVSPGFSVRAV